MGRESRRPPTCVLSLLIAGVAVVLLACCAAVRESSLPGTDARSLVRFPGADTLRAFEGLGDVSFAFDGERHRARIRSQLHPDGRFESDLHSLFGQVIMLIRSDRDSMDFIVGDMTYRSSGDGLPETVPFLRRYPFTSGDLVRILTGRTQRTACLGREPDSIAVDGRVGIHEWRCDSQHVRVTVSRRRGTLRRIVCVGERPARWRLALSSFEQGVAREIRFESEADNYFFIAFDQVMIRR